MCATGGVNISSVLTSNLWPFDPTAIWLEYRRGPVLLLSPTDYNPYHRNRCLVRDETHPPSIDRLTACYAIVVLLTTWYFTYKTTWQTSVMKWQSVRYAPYKVHRVKPFPRDEYHSLIDGELSACHAIMLIIYTDELGVVCYDWSIDWVLTAGDLYTLLYFLIFVIVQAVLFSYDYAVTDEKATFIKQLSWTPPFQVSTH